MKSKLISIVFSVTSVAFILLPSIIPNVSAGIIYNEKANGVSEKSLDERIAEFELFLNNVIKNNYLFRPFRIKQICEDVTKVLKEEPHLLKVEGAAIIVGDTHSDMGSVDCCCRKFLEELKEEAKNKELKETKTGKTIIFLGDYVDRGYEAPGGPNGIKNVMLLFKLKTLFPDRVVLLRGNHENEEMNSLYGFWNECCEKYMVLNKEDDVFDDINGVFDQLSLAAIINDKILCVHGGISEYWKSLEQISALKKPLLSKQCYDNPLINEILWNDPSNDVYNYAENPRGEETYIYGKYAVRRFYKETGLKSIIRAHQLVEKGHEDIFNDSSVITVFSAPNYCNMKNTASFIELGKDNSIKYGNISYSSAILEEYLESINNIRGCPKK